MKNVVTVGGGTGSYTVLSGLKHIPSVSLSALVSMADDGGSTGILREKWKVMPGGDVRQCLAALSGKEFLNHKLNNGFLKGHKVGNIFLAILEKITGNFTRGLSIISFLLNSKGKIIPITKDSVVLCARLIDGTVIKGENKIDTAELQSTDGVDLVEEVFYQEKANLNPTALNAILSADYIIIGPGNIYCSIIPNFITLGFKEAIGKSKAKIIFLMNLVNKQGHTMDWGAEKYVNIIEKYLGKKIDMIFMNKEEFATEQKKRYMDDGGEKIFIKEDYNDVRIVREDLVLNNTIFKQDKEDSVKRSLIRHDSKKLATVLAKYLQ